MIAFYLTLFIPIFGALLMLFIGQKRCAGITNISLTLGDFLASGFLAVNFLRHGELFLWQQQFHIDAFSLLSIILTTFIMATTAIFSHNYMWHNVVSGKISTQKLRLYHVMYQLFAFMMLLTLSTNNIGILWVAMEGATLATVLLVSLYRTAPAIEAAWKYFILCIVGIALALFGTILFYSSAAHVAVNNSAILWSVLHDNALILSAPTTKAAFIFLLVGYGTKIGLVPFHNWLPDAHSESPAPMSTLLSGLLLNLALYALVRFKILADLALNNNWAGKLMMTFGLLSFLIAAILLHRQKNIKRLFSYSSIEHMGLMAFAFGLNGRLATFGALFYMLMHSLTKSAIFVTVGNVIQLYGTQSMDEIRGLLKRNPMLGWILLIACCAISGLPPFGIFTSEIFIFIAAIKEFPWLAILIGLGLITALAGLLRNIQPIVYGENSASKFGPMQVTNLFPAILHLILVLILGVYIPSTLYQLLQQSALLIAG